VSRVADAIDKIINQDEKIMEVRWWTEDEQLAAKKEIHTDSYIALRLQVFRKF